MIDRESKKERLKTKSQASRAKADELLNDELEILRKANKTDIENLCPKTASEELYNKLIAEVNESTRQNESVAELNNRVKKLGSDAIHLAKDIVKLLR